MHRALNVELRAVLAVNTVHTFTKTLSLFIVHDGRSHVRGAAAEPAAPDKKLAAEQPLRWGVARRPLRERVNRRREQ